MLLLRLLTVLLAWLPLAISHPITNVYWSSLVPWLSLWRWPWILKVVIYYPEGKQESNYHVALVLQEVRRGRRQNREYCFHAEASPTKTGSARWAVQVDKPWKSKPSEGANRVVPDTDLWRELVIEFPDDEKYIDVDRSLLRRLRSAKLLPAREIYDGRFYYIQEALHAMGVGQYISLRTAKAYYDDLLKKAKQHKLIPLHHPVGWMYDAEGRKNAAGNT